VHNPVNPIRFRLPAAVELMEFLDTLRNICKPLDRGGVSFALIGGLALAMRGVQRATRIDVGDDLSLPVAAVEDLIGLKIQAAFNDPSRAQADWLDIRRLLEAAAHRGEEPDWSLIADYLEVFEQSERIDDLRGWHGKTD
jgi:hypothetical protein